MEPLTDSSDMLLEDFREFEEYISKMTTRGKMTNPKSICVLCWCYLDFSQKQVQTARAYANLDGFIAFTLQNGRFKEKDGQMYYQKLPSYVTEES